MLTFLLISCGGDPGTQPTGTPPALPVLAPAPAPTPVPTPAAENLQSDTYCVPKPPPIVAFKINVHSDRGWKKILDSRAKVGPDGAYCAAQDFGGTVCVVRREDDPQAQTCNNLVVGRSDTGRYGPNWFYNDDTPCRPAGEGDNDAGCRVHEGNQYLVYAFGPGKYTACSEDAVCTDFVIK